MSWKTYALSVAAFSVVSLVVLYAILGLQEWLPIMRPELRMSPLTR
jgi:K+-transporting ATPase A subunit